MTLSPRFLALLALLAGISVASGQVPPPPVEPEAPASAATETPNTEPRAEPEGPPPTEKAIGKLSAQLNSDDFKTREAAQIELTRLATDYPEATLDTILREYLNTTVPEARYRLRGILYRSKKEEFMEVPRGFVGIVMNSVFARGENGEVIHAIQVMRVVKDSAAEKFGLQLMDQIIAIDGKPLSADDALGDFANYVTAKAAGDEVELTVQRRLEKRKINLTLGQRPADLLGQDPRLMERFDADFKRWLDEGRDRLREKK